MLVNISGVSAPPRAATIDADPPEPSASPVNACTLPPDRFTQSDPTNNPDAFHNAIASLTAPLNNVADPVGGASPVAGKIETNPDVANGRLPPATKIVEPNGYIFVTDQQGRVTDAVAQLKINPNGAGGRSAATKAAQKEVGWEDRLPDDHGGHIIAHRFDGPGEMHNLFAQNGNFNLGAYKKLENSWATSLENGHAVKVEVQLHYAKNSLRPDELTVKTRIDSSPIVVTNTFYNAPGGKAPATVKAAGVTDSALEGGSKGASETAGALSAANASKVARGLEVVDKVAPPIAAAADAYSIYSAYRQDGNRIGSQTVQQAGSVAGGWAGATIGAEAGAEGGAAVGAFFGGVGAVPGAIIGGAVGGVVGGIAGSDVGKAAVKLGQDGVDAGKKAFHKVAHFFHL